MNASVSFVCCLALTLALAAGGCAALRLDDGWNKPTVHERADADLFPVSIIHWNDFHAR